MKKRNVFVLGALMGAAAVALLTPKSGKEMQKELLNKVDEIQNKIKDIEIEDVKQSFTAKLDEIKDLVNNFDWESSKAELESKVNDVKEKLNDMLVRVEEAKDTVKDEVKSFGDDLEDDFTIVIDAVKDGAKDVKEKATEVCASGNWAEDDGNIALFIADNEQLEAAAVSKDILLKISNGVEPHDICILCKQKPQDYASAIIEELEKHGVRARIETGYQDLIKEPIVDLFIKFMICADSRKHPNEWTFIEESLVELWGISGMRENDTFDEMQRKLSAVVNVVKKNIQQKLDTEQWHSTLNSIIDFFGIGNIKAKFPAYKQGTYFMNVINQFESLFFEEYVAAHGVWNLAIENFRGDHSVPIMTIHKSKGLEYNAVYFIGLEDSAFWNFRNQPDEDRCTFFVALSRAKASVTFTFCKKRTGMKCPMQRHNAINEFFDLLQRPGIAEVKRFQNR